MLALGCLIAFVTFTVWYNVRLGQRQRQAAFLRPQIEVPAFVDHMVEAGICASIAEAIHKELSAYCASGISLHPTDSLQEFLEIDIEERDFIIERLLGQLGLTEPSREETRQWHPDTPLEVGHMLQQWAVNP